MKEAIRMVLECIYDPEFPDTSHFRSRRGCHSVLRRIKEEWVSSRWFLEFDIRKSFHTIDRHRLILILKEEIDDPKFFDSIRKVFYDGRIIGGSKETDYVPQSVLLSALPGNIYLHKLDQDIGRIRQKYEMESVPRMRSLLLRTGRIEDQENLSQKEEERFNALQPQDKRAIIVGRSIQPSTFHSFLSSWHTHTTSNPRLMRDQKWPFLFTHSSYLSAFLNKPSSLLCAALLIEGDGLTQKDEFYGREGSNKNWAMRDFSSKRKRSQIKRMIELGGEARLVIRSERGLARNQATFFNHYKSKMRIEYERYADDLLLGIVGDLELLREIQKRINYFLQAGLWVDSAGSTRIAPRSTVEFLGTVIRKVPPRTTPIKFLRELEKRIRIKQRIHRTACQLRSAIHSQFRKLGQNIPIKELTKGMSGRWSLLDAVQLAETLGRAGVKSKEVSILGGTVKHIREGERAISFLHSSVRIKVTSDQEVSRSGTHGRKLSLSTPAGRKSTIKKGGGARSISSEFPIQIEAPIKKILRRLRDRGLISRRRPWPIHVACLTNVSDGDIVTWYAGIAISLMSYYRCRDNLYQVRRIVDHQIRWSAIFTSAHKHKSSARKIIQKYSKDSRVNQEGGQNHAEFPNSIELGKLGYGQDTNKK